jgi:hypothetical protein
MVSLELADRKVAPNCIGRDPGQKKDKADRNGDLMLMVIGLFTALSLSGGHRDPQLPPVDSLRVQVKEPLLDVKVSTVFAAS